MFNLKTLLAFVLMTISFFSHASYNKPTIELKFASWIDHTYSPNGKFNEGWNNDLFTAGFYINPTTNIMVGTLKNSDDNRCFVAGVDHEWYDFGNGFKLKGSYLYTGEMFFDAFSHCGDESFYKKVKDSTGIGFAPYINHYVEYSVSKNFAMDLGIMLPGITVFNLKAAF